MDEDYLVSVLLYTGSPGDDCIGVLRRECTSAERDRSDWLTWL